jgi:hypothetical protein
MTDATHTPTPWALNLNWVGHVYDVAGPDYQPICMVALDEHHHDVRLANAAFIVKAVNAHEALVEALEDARLELEAYELAATGEGYNNLAINFALELAEHSEPMERGA